ncbi:MAG TPA: hypothetical protein VKQ08_09670 [Cyclobacteriaceae bacterium]|nr:hypothetical protein [Cyclobacteriaceae bacterium]
MIAAFGKIPIDKIIDGAISLSQGLNATHEYSKCCPEDTSEGIRHNDGWGAVYLNRNRDLSCVKSGMRIDKDTKVTGLKRLETSAFVIHVRKASVKWNTGIEFVHPIESQVNDRPAYFFHNGFAPDIFRLLGRRRSVWDSEELYEWLAPSFSAQAKPPLEHRLNQLPSSTTSANFIFIQMERLVVCNWFSNQCMSPQYYTMRLLKTEDQTIIASDWISEIAPLEDWHPIPNKTILCFDLSPG